MHGGSRTRARPVPAILRLVSSLVDGWDKFKKGRKGESMNEGRDGEKRGKEEVRKKRLELGKEGKFEGKEERRKERRKYEWKGGWGEERKGRNMERTVGIREGKKEGELEG